MIFPKKAERKNQRLYGTMWALGFLALVFLLFVMSLMTIPAKPNRTDKSAPAPTSEGSPATQPKL